MSHPRPMVYKTGMFIETSIPMIESEVIIVRNLLEVAQRDGRLPDHTRHRMLKLQHRLDEHLAAIQRSKSQSTRKETHADRTR